MDAIDAWPRIPYTITMPVFEIKDEYCSPLVFVRDTESPCKKKKKNSVWTEVVGSPENKRKRLKEAT